MEQTVARGVARTVVTDKTGNSAFDQGAKGHIELEIWGCGVENGAALPVAVVTDEDHAAANLGLCDLGGLGLLRFGLFRFGRSNARR